MNEQPNNNSSRAQDLGRKFGATAGQTIERALPVAGGFFRWLTHFLSRISDALVDWSWWRVIGLAILMMIAGGMLDEAFIPDPKEPVKARQVIKVDRSSTDKAKRDITITVDKSANRDPVKIKIGPGSIKLTPSPDGDGTLSAQLSKAKQALETAKKELAAAAEEFDSTVAQAGTSKAAEAKVKLAEAKRAELEAAVESANDLVERLSEAEAAAKEAASQAANALGNLAGSNDREKAELKEKIEKAVSQVLGSSDNKKSPIISVETEHDRQAGKAEPFKALAAFLVISLFILKFVGGSRLRERAATVRADVARQSADDQNLQRQIAEAKLLRMQAQVEPHFLFNTLAALERLIEVNPTRALAMSQALSQWLRALLPQMKEGQSTVGQEINLVQSYLQLMQMRMGERLAYFIDMPESLRGEQLPSMFLQPLVENSIKHGLEPKKLGGEIRIKARRVGDELVLSVEDTGVGFSSNPNNGNGLTNLRERLELLYGGRAMLSITPRGSVDFSLDSNVSMESISGTVITIKIPVSAAKPPPKGNADSVS
jgi:two-component sensor histidine kinase